MVAISDKKLAYQKALLIASGPAMLEKMVRPLKDFGLAVNACESFKDARQLYDTQALVVLPLKDDGQDEAREFIDWMRDGAERLSPYLLGVGRCDEGQRKALVAKLRLNDLISLPYSEDEVKERLSSYRRWCRLPDSTEAKAENPDEETPLTVPDELAKTAKVSLFAGGDAEDDDEAPEVIYCREAPVGIAMFDREMRYMMANPRWIQQFRLKDKEIMGRSQFDVFPKLHQGWRRIYQRCLNGETRRGREMAPSAHEPVEMRWEVRPWHYRAGQIGGVTIAFEEVWNNQDDLKSVSGKEPQPVVPKPIAPPEPAASPKPDAPPGPEPSLDDLDVPAVLVNLEGDVIEANAKARGLTAGNRLDAGTPLTAAFPGAADFQQHAETLKKGSETLTVTSLERHESGHLAWSHSLHRTSAGEIDGVLRLGIFIEERLLPKPEPAPAEEPPEGSAGTASALALLQSSVGEVAAPPEIDSFEDDDLNEAAELIWKANTRGEITFFNNRWLEFRGRPLQRELNGGWLDGLHAADARATKAVVAEAIREHKNLEHTFRLKSGEGEFLKIDMWVRPYHDDNDELLGFVGLCRAPQAPVTREDVAGFALPSPVAEPADLEKAKKEADEALKKVAEAEKEIEDLREMLEKASSAGPVSATSASVFRDKVFASSPTILWASDAKGRLTAVNRQWERLRGRALADEMPDGWLQGITNETERNAVRDRLQSCADEGLPLKCRFTWTDADERARLMEMHGTPLLDSEGLSQGLTGSLIDITDSFEALTTVRDLVSPEASGTTPDGLTNDLFRQLADKVPGWRKRQELLAKDAAMFRDIFDHVSAGIVLLGSDGNAIFANKRHRELLGFGIEDSSDVEGWLRRACPNSEHAEAVLKVWQQDIWQRQLTKVMTLTTAAGVLREIEIQPQLFLDDNRLLLTFLDVTESRRSEEALRDSEIRFRALFRDSAMGIALSDAEDKVYDINPALEALLGLPRRRLLCKRFDDCIDPEDVPRKRAMMDQLLGSPKRSASVELRLRPQQSEDDAHDEPSEEIWVRLHVSLVKDVDQRVLFTAYFVHDVTEQKRIQAELQISQEQNRALLEAIPDLIMLVDRRGLVIDLLPSDDVPINAPDDETIGQGIERLVPAFAGQITRLIEQAYLDDDVVHFRYSVPRDQSKDHFEVRIVACKPDNAVVTIQREARAQAEVPEAIRLQSLCFHNAPEAVVVTNYTGEILDWNPAAEQFFGYAKKDAVGQALPRLFGMDSVESLTKELSNGGKGHRWEGEVPFRHKDGTQGVAHLVFQPLKSELGSLSGQVAFVRAPQPAAPPPAPEGPDIEKIHETARQESLEKLVPQMHQRLRNNLQIIGTLLNLQFKAQSDVDMRETLLISRNRALTLSTLHDQIRTHEDEVAIDFHQFVRRLVDQLLGAYNAADRVRVLIDIQDRLDLQVASPLALILNELVTNAIRHGFPKPESGTVHIALQLADGKGQLSVSDDGVGFPNDRRDEEAQLGLQIVRTLAKQVGGNLEKIDTTETEFRVYFTTALRK